MVKQVMFIRVQE